MEHFLIVTPCLNAGHFIDDTIMSVVTQSGNFSLRYHIHDGGSTDDTSEKLETWSRRLQKGQWPRLCNELTFSYSTGEDEGMYDAINKAFVAICTDSPSEAMMTWINAGDRLGQGSVQAVASICRQYLDVAWTAGVFAQLNDEGSAIRYGQCTAVSQRAMHAGLYDGRRFGFLQQEGTFWSRNLWSAIGQSVNSTLKVAGDFDLWRSLAGHAPCVSINTVTGFFRRHSHGLTSDMSRYFAEIDRLIGGPGAVERDAIYEEYRRLKAHNDVVGMARAGFLGTIISWDSVKNHWGRRTVLISH